ncbi:putative membrane protein [Babesia divergens]|uniref:Membrane protein n=1 Tax=Babesia divergens TaxID=32595 RepID=A0AAD9G6T4_BABDI|nr:putative membrane protein [Babesia divergens]
MLVPERNELIPWRTVSYVMCILLLGLQHVGMMHYMYQCQSWCLYLAILDAICLCNWIFYTVPKMIGIKGANCWIIYSRMMTVKILVVYYIVFPSVIAKRGIVLRYPCGASTEILLLLLLTPTLYALMSFRAGVHLYGGLNCISSERLMHTDLIIHVALDLLDVVDMCHIFTTITNTLQHKNYILKAFCGVVVGTGVFLHSYSFPRMSETSKFKNSSGFKGDSLQSASDIYYCRKYAAIVGIFFVDVPFGILRFVAWLLLAKHSIFGLFLLKNICFVMIQASRIRHCSIGIRTLNSSKELNNSHDDDPMDEDAAPMGNAASRSDYKKPSVRFSTMVDPLKDDIEDNPLHRRTIRLSTMHMRKSCATRITIPEGFSIAVVNFKRLLQKILMVITVGSKSEIAHLLDSKLHLSLWQNAMMAIPHIVVWVTEVTIVIMLYRLDEKPVVDYRGLFDFVGLSKLSFNDLPLGLKATPIVILAASLINLICWSLVGPLLGAIFVAIHVLVTLVSFSYVLLSLSEFIPALHILAFISQHIMGTPRDYLFFLFGIRPFLNLLSGLYPFLCLTLGKHYIFYINPSVVNMQNSDLLRDSVKFINNKFAIKADAMSHDESCAISLASLLALTNATIMCAPPSGHSILVGPNLIKATRLDMALVSSHKNMFMRTGMIRMYCILMVVGKNGHAYSCAIMFYMLHMLLIALYGLYSMSVRRINIEAVSTQAVCLDILKETKSQRVRYNKLMAYEKNHVNTRPLTTNHYIFKKHQRNKLFL